MKTLIVILTSILLFSCGMNSNKSEIEALEKRLNEQSALIDSLSLGNQNKYSSSNQKNKEEINLNTKTNSSNGYNTYCNSRYSFCIEYPSDFIPNGESGNGDGQTFSSNDGKTLITVFGNLNGTDLNSDFRASINNSNVVYKKKGDDYYVISGKSNGSIYYQKTIQREIDYFGNKDTEILVNYKIRYPVSQKKRFNEFCKRINANFK